MLAFMINRDRLSYARQCAAALTSNPADLKLMIVDHGSTFGPMRRWLDWTVRYAGATVVRMPNQHPRDLWAPGNVLEQYVQPGERFIVTDHDVVPDGSCPARWVEAMGRVLDDNPHVVKVGLGLRTDDLPAHYEHRDKVIEWEAQWQSADDGGRAPCLVSAGAGVLADVDTTLAMYRFLEPFQLGPAVRMRSPFLARHLPWYEDGANPTHEQAYYRDHAEHGHWRAPDGFADEHGLGGST